MSQIFYRIEEKIIDKKMQLYEVSFEGSTVVVVTGFSYTLSKSFVENSTYRAEDKRRSDTLELYAARLSKDNILPQISSSRLGNEFRTASCHERLTNEECNMPNLNQVLGENDQTTFPNLSIILSKSQPSSEKLVTEFVGK